MRWRVWIAAVVSFWSVAGFAQVATRPGGGPELDLGGVSPDSAVRVARSESGVVLTWPAGDGKEATLRIGAGETPTFSASLGETRVFENARPVYTMRIGQRDMNPAGWIHFFDKVDERPFETLPVEFYAGAVKVSSSATRATVRVGPAKCGSFAGDLEVTVFAGLPLVEVAAVMTTQEDARAILYDPGLELPVEGVRQVAFETYDGKVVCTPPAAVEPGPVRAHLRTVVAETGGGTVAVFPPPHGYFVPLDFANNFGFNAIERSGDRLRIGMRQPPHGDGRYRPWANAPPGTAQRLGMFVLLSSGEAKAALDGVRAYTRDDRVPEVAGHKAMVSHLHIEHTEEVLNQQRHNADMQSVPWALENPGWLQLLKARGIQIAHLAEFHFGDTPQRKIDRRMLELKTLYSECARLSDGNFLVVPGEEPNVHLGGHWISLFPRPVYWVLNRGTDEPFAEQREGLTVYRVGNAADVLELFRREQGLMWTAHPRIKGSQNFPDAHMGSDYFKSEQFLGGAWKNMPADYSRDRLGERVLDLANDEANKGFRKPVLGEIDLFQMDPTYELYGHLNVNYLELDRLPKFKEGWQPVLDCLKGGKFFTTTGEVLIEDVHVGAARPGGASEGLGKTTVTAKLTFTFPPAFAEVVSGDGQKTYRERVDLSGWAGFETREISIPVDLTGRTWARLEVWDVARDGAFTPPVWINR